jgi:O-antigen ligase
MFSITYAKNRGAAVNETLRFLEYACIFYLVLLNADSRFIKRGLFLFCTSMVIASLFGIFQYIFNLSTFTAGAYFGKGRVYATFENPDYWGAVINLVIFYPLIYMIENKKGKRVLNGILFVLFFINLLFSCTAGSWTGFAVGLFVIALLRYRRTLFAVPVLAVVGFAVPAVRNRLLSIFNLNEHNNFVRLKLWKTGLKMFKDYPLGGVGNGNYLARYVEYIKRYKELNAGRNQYSVHNSYIKMLAELGIFGGISFVAIYLTLLSMAYKVYKNSREYKFYALALLGFWGAYLLYRSEYIL